MKCLTKNCRKARQDLPENEPRAYCIACIAERKRQRGRDADKRRLRL